jgi:hypothetical protein
MKDLLRIAYRGMIRLYPSSFRGEFEDEMLWIYDEEMRSEQMRDKKRSIRCVALFFDAACAIVRQQVNSRMRRPVPVAYYVEVDSALPAQRIAQAMLVMVYAGFCLCILLAPWVSMIKPSSHGVWFVSHIQDVVAIPAGSPGKM